MPIFEFECKDCGQKFDLMISNADKDKVKCPQCGTGNIKQLISLFNSSGGGSKYSNLPPGCAGCAQQGG
ncbi:MAG: zinc ribbon domain-containing protein [Syntrophomonadaceae bacterium]|nr:zinc ribbon domain-containing protein [Syntrophomonadaceae bacterium]